VSELDIVIPVYEEGEHILPVLDALRRSVATPFRVLLCYDHEGDSTLPAVRGYRGVDITLVKNRGQGAHGAVMSGFAAGTAPAVLVMPADDTDNAPIIDRMVARWSAGCEIVVASRLMPGGRMEGCPWLKNLLVRIGNATLYRLARVPTRDATNGFRLFSRRLVELVVIESTAGFAYSIELLVKCHRLGWRIDEMPAVWFERRARPSRFRVLAWLPLYLRWLGYAFATTYLRRSAATVKLRVSAAPPQPVAVPAAQP